MEHTSHDEINLVRLVRRLEKSVATPSDWDTPEGMGKEWTWLKAQKDLQKVKYARKLVKNVEIYDEDALAPHKIKQRNDIKIKLDKVETFLKDVQTRTQPSTQRPEPLLPSIPIPAPKPPPRVFSPPPDQDAPHSALIPLDTPALPSSPLPPSFLPSSPTPTSSISLTTALAPSSTLIPRKPPSNQTHAALQDSLSLQLAQMASQLKRNAEHFSTTLAADNALILGTQEKIEANYDAMHKARVMVRDLRGKTGGTTCLVLAVVMCVLGVFVMMVGVIRFSRI